MDSVVSEGSVYSKNGATQQTVTTSYGADGRIATAGFLHSGNEKQFNYEYLPGTNLLQTLVKPNNMTLTQSYESQRNLLIGMDYHRSSTLVAQRSYTYDALARPLTRTTARNGSTVNDSFGYNSRSELNIATVNNKAYAYDYDNIGNRAMAQEAAESATTYESNQLNQYTAIGDFEPAYDDAGNQTKVKTSTGIWSVVYNAENRPISFINEATGTVVECTYDYMGRRATKKVSVNGSVTLHQRFLYRGYLQIACCDLTRSNHPCLWLITWDPLQPVATRPLAIQKDGTWYTYGWDLTKNICEVYGQHGYIRTAYTYSPYGQVETSGDVTQPIQWSSEYLDTELGLIYYNYRHYNPMDGRWIGRDRIGEGEDYKMYVYCRNSAAKEYDYIGLTTTAWEEGDVTDIAAQTYSLDFPSPHTQFVVDSLILLISGKKLLLDHILGSLGAIANDNKDAPRFLAHYLAGTGTDLTYHPDKKLPGVEGKIREGKEQLIKSSQLHMVRMSSWELSNSSKRMLYTLGKYFFAVGLYRNENCKLTYRYYIYDTYNFDYKPMHSREVNKSIFRYSFHNAIYLTYGVMDVLAGAKPFKVKGEMTGTLEEI